jgi:tetratricopeptide (TPR) repeat protein
VLLVADYAETRIGLEELLRGVVADNGKIRLLLLARSAGQWWEQLAAGEGAIRDLIVQEGPDGVQLGEVLDDTVSDEDQVLRAIPVFAAKLGVSPPEYVAVATQPRRARVLELHAAALVAVLEWILAPKLKPRVELGGVLNELLQHEERFWLRSVLAQGLVYGSTRITPTMLRQVVAAGCLLGAADQNEAVALLGRVPAVPQSVMPALAVWLRELYPPGRDSNEWLGTIQPDRLAERLVISQLGSSEELTQACLSDLGERQARQALLLLGRAATEDDIAERLLRRLLPLVAQVIKDIDAPLEILVSIANAIPYPSMALGQAHAAITSRILDTPAAQAHPSEYARWLTIRGLTLTQLSRPWEALPFTEQAVGLYRELASVNPGRYKPDLAGSLANLGIGLSEIGRAADALAVTQEALTLYRNAAWKPDGWKVGWAASLTVPGFQ